MMLVKFMRKFLDGIDGNRDIIFMKTGESLKMDQIGFSVIESRKEKDLFSEED